MKADLSLPENRAAFCALYFGQKILRSHNWNKVVPNWEINSQNMECMYYEPRYYLELRPISSLNLEECGICADILNIRNDHDLRMISQYRTRVDLINDILTGTQGVYNGPIAHVFQLSDYIRSIGILIPFRGNSCEEIIEAGLCVYRKEGE